MSPTSGVLRRGIPHEGAAVGAPRALGISTGRTSAFPKPAAPPPYVDPRSAPGAEGRLVRFNGVPAEPGSGSLIDGAPGREPVSVRFLQKKQKRNAQVEPFC